MHLHVVNTQLYPAAPTSAGACQHKAACLGKESVRFPSKLGTKWAGSLTSSCRHTPGEVTAACGWLQEPGPGQTCWGGHARGVSPSGTWRLLAQGSTAGVRSRWGKLPRDICGHVDMSRHSCGE